MYRHLQGFVKYTRSKEDKTDHPPKLRTGTNYPDRSFWSPLFGGMAGATILVDLYGGLTDAKPRFEDRRNAHFMAVKCTLKGTRIMALSVDAPHQRGRREHFYRDLVTSELPEGMMVIMGGGFNCTLDSVADHSYQATCGDARLSRTSKFSGSVGLH
ncbi:hypothetical protein PC123_g19361 [Phytophthora cactorum]|nr:hypothetical protein PC123_g19361 [Phytophthora cactorum]